LGCNFPATLPIACKDRQSQLESKASPSDRAQAIILYGINTSNTEVSKTAQLQQNYIMNTNKKYIVTLLILAIATSISSCNSNPTVSNTKEPTPAPATPTPTPTSQPTPSIGQLRAKTTPSPDSKAVTDKNINVTVYTSDTQCQELIPKKVTVPAQEPVTSAVGKIIEEQDTADFNLSGYRVIIQDGVATVDLRIAPDSQRQLTSLSSCEQFALFGSLRKTLTSNAQWKIKEVRFTERGEEIVL
jgi:hypothetical protein